MPEVDERRFGLGIEHEFHVFRDNGNTIEKIARPTEAAGYRGTDIVYTNEDRVVSTYNLRPREKRLVTIGTDGTVQGGYELATINWKHGTVEKLVKQLRDAEKYIIKKGQDMNPNHRVSILPFGVVGTSADIAPGSYHFTITFPYNTTDECRKNMKKFVAHLQWIEPILFSMMGGASPFSLGDAGRESECSVRVSRNGYGNPGGTNPENFVRTLDVRRGTGDSLRWSSLLKMFDPPRKSDTDVVNSQYAATDAIEIRVFDRFSSDGLKNFVKTLFYCASNAIDRDVAIPVRAGNNEYWNQAMARVLEEGYNAYLPKQYIQALKEQLKIPINTEGSVRAIDVMRQVENKLWDINKDKNIAKTFITNRENPPLIHCFTKDAWNFFLKRKLRTDSRLRTKFNKFINVITNKLEIETSDGWIKPVEKNASEAGVRNIIKKEMGQEWSDEDTRDIIDFLDDKLFEVRRKPDGTIDAIKLKFTAAETKKKIRKLIEDTSFYENAEGLDTLQVERILTEAVVRESRALSPGDRVRIKRDYPDDMLNDIFRDYRDREIVGIVVSTVGDYREHPTESSFSIGVRINIGDNASVVAPFDSLELVEDTEPYVEMAIPPRQRPARPAGWQRVTEAGIPDLAIRSPFRFNLGAIVRHRRGGRRTIRLHDVGIITGRDVFRNRTGSLINMYLVRVRTHPSGRDRYTRWEESTLETSSEEFLKSLWVAGYRPRRGPGWYSTHRGKIVKGEVRRHVRAGQKGALRQGKRLRRKRMPRKVGDFNL